VGKKTTNIFFNDSTNRKSKDIFKHFFWYSFDSEFHVQFFSIVNAQIPFDSPIETDEAFLIYNGQWIIQTPIHGNKTKLNIMDTWEELTLLWNETFVSSNIQQQMGLVKGKERTANKYFRFFDTSKFFVDIPVQAAGVLGILEEIRKTKRTKYTKCSL